MAFKVNILVISIWTLAMSSSGLEDNSFTPVIGILVQKVNEYQPEVSEKEYIDAEYVKFIESSGGRAVPIFHTLTDEELEYTLESINGVLFPGGDVPLISSNYYKTAQKIFKWAIEANKKGDHFPIWGTCLGFQTLNGLRANTDEVLSKCNNDDVSVPLNLTVRAESSKLLSGVSQDFIKLLSSEPVIYYTHFNCVTPEEYETNKLLNSFFRIVSTNRDKDGKEFISTIEAIDYPFFGVQWHPEKNTFADRATGIINHSKDARRVTKEFGAILMREASKSSHRYVSRNELMKNVINRYGTQLFAEQEIYHELYIF